ncbi:MAG: hypothetical protein AAF799_16345 [Myxococcota bacterium]
MSESLPDAPPFISRYRWRSRLGTALTIAILSTTSGIVWYGFIRAPSPRSTCDHVSDLRRSFPQDSHRLDEAITPLAADNGPSMASTSSDQRCTWYFTTQQKELSYMAYGTLTRCVTGAETPTELLTCL